jgi:magnesium transporter
VDHHLAVPTAVAGIYGMNFEHMPELSWRYGYPIVLGLIALICVVLFVRSRRAGGI